MCRKTSAEGRVRREECRVKSEELVRWKSNVLLRCRRASQTEVGRSDARSAGVRPYRETNGEHRCCRLLDSDGVGAARREARPGRPEGMTKKQKRP